MYSHVVYDIVPDEKVVVSDADIVIIEGPQRAPDPEWRRHAGFVSDYFDFSIYVDADEDDIEQWYVDRFLAAAGVGVPGSRLVLPVLRRTQR